MSRAPLVVYSPSRWDYLWQRPQQILTRMARVRPVYYIEEPCHDSHSMPRWELRLESGLTIGRPHTAVRVPGFSDPQRPALRRLMRDLFIEQGLESHVAWLYSPTALPLASELAPRLLVYDSPGESSRFLETPSDFDRQEQELLRRADLVFSEIELPMPPGRASRLRMLESSVDVEHFALARRCLREAEDQRAIPGPRIGYFGVIDERLDLELLEGVARARPDWSIVLVGHVARRDPAALPRHDNLHWLGARDHVDLPSYLAGWDAVILPLFTHEAGRPLGATRALESMAAGRPVISTPIPEMVDRWQGLVRFGRSVDEFVAACERTLAAVPAEQSRRLKAMDQALGCRSWDATVEHMDAELWRFESAPVTPLPVAGQVTAARDGTDAPVRPRHHSSAEVLEAADAERRAIRVVPA